MGSKRTTKTSSSTKKSTRSSKAAKNGGMKMTMCTVPTIVSRAQPRERRPGRPPGGKKLVMTRNYPGKIRSMARRSLDPCDNSNDSGLGFDHHTDPHLMVDRLNWTDERAHKRARLDIKLENDEVNDSYCFPETVHCKENTNLIRTAPSGTISNLNTNNNQNSTTRHTVPRCAPLLNKNAASTPLNLTTQLNNTAHNGDISLSILSQPEQQHRARYQTEGSRGAVKDRTGNSFPIVKLIGYNKPATLQVFIGTDLGKVAPHMFYQACKVSGKNSTPCSEKKVDGTIVIELQLDPAKEMIATCDCVGILKERNVDVEHRFPEQLGSRNKKKSTRCRMVFRTTITHDDGKIETLQICSQPIVCTQPPGIPEICKKSLTSCPASGGLELFILGKNFLKDTTVRFQQTNDERHTCWEESVVPDKEFLQQTHLVCVVPPYRHQNITEPVTVRLYVVSSGKNSEAHQFVYTPINGAVPSVRLDAPIQTQQPPSPPQQQQLSVNSPNETTAPFLSKMGWSLDTRNKEADDLGMMPPPGTSLVPLSQRRPSATFIQEANSPPMRIFKQEIIDENSQNSIMDSNELHQERYRHLSESSLDVHHSDSNLSIMTENSNMSQTTINENSNLSLVNENSLDMMTVRNSVSASNSMTNNTQLTANNNAVTANALTINNPLTVNTNLPTMLHGLIHGSNGLPLNLATSLENNNGNQTGLLQPVPSTNNMQELNVMDLRMKIPMATIADLANTKEPSLATLQSFGVTEITTNPLPAQSGQSVENYLTNLENKTLIAGQNNFVFRQKLQEIPIGTYVTKTEPTIEAESTTNTTTEKLDALVNSAVDTHITNSQTDERKVMLVSNVNNNNNVSTQQDVMLTSRDVILNSQQALMPIINTSTTILNGNSSILNGNSPILNGNSSILNGSSSILSGNSPILNANSTILNGNSTMLNVNSPILNGNSPNSLNMNSPSILNGNSPNVLNGNSSSMLNSSSSSIMNGNSPMINTTLPSPTLVQNVVITGQQQQQGSPNLSPDVILNTQLSPSLMCRTNNTQLNQDSLLSNNLSPNQIQDQLINNNGTPLTLQDPEKVILLNAAVDLYETQNKIKELTKTNGVVMRGLLTPTNSNLLETNNANLNNNILNASTRSDAILTPVNDGIVTTNDGLLVSTNNGIMTTTNDGILATSNPNLLNGNNENILTQSTNASILTTANNNILAATNNNILASTNNANILAGNANLLPTSTNSGMLSSTNGGNGLSPSGNGNLLAQTNALSPTGTNRNLLPSPNNSTISTSNNENLLTTSNNSNCLPPTNGSMLPSSTNDNVLNQSQLCQLRENYVETNNIQASLMAVVSSTSPTVSVKTLPDEDTKEFMSVPTIKEIPGQNNNDKKNEDRMIPTVFDTMTENELISMINPSCFDQV